MGREEPLDIPKTGKERLTLMKDIAKGWAEPFQELVISIPEDTDAKAIAPEEFVPKERLWDNMKGRATLVGDAAHTMPMCTYQSTSLCWDLEQCSWCFKTGAKARITALPT